LKVILHCFELAFGLKVNFSKSRIGGVGVDHTVLQQYAAILNCEVMKNPFKYLGLLVGGSHKRVSFWDGVLERVKSRLGRWKGRFLSLAGRVCLIKSVLSSISLFYISMYKFPSAMLKEIEKIQRRFLWGYGSEGRKIEWVSWKKACKPREAGDLGILNLRLFNAALLGKWIWRLETKKGGLWKEILESKYGGWRNLQKQRSNAKDSNWWRDLKGVWGMEE